MPHFTPPATDTVATTLADTTGPAKKLFRFYRPRPEGVNIYLWDDGTVTQADPDGTTTIWRESDRTGDTLPDAKILARVFYGGHDDYEITQAEADALTEAGYEVDA